MKPMEGPNQNRSHPKTQCLRSWGKPQDSNRQLMVDRPLALITLTSHMLARKRGCRSQGLNQQTQWPKQWAQQP